MIRRCGSWLPTVRSSRVTRRSRTGTWNSCMRTVEIPWDGVWNTGWIKSHSRTRSWKNRITSLWALWPVSWSSSRSACSSPGVSQNRSAAWARRVKSSMRTRTGSGSTVSRRQRERTRSASWRELLRIFLKTLIITQKWSIRAGCHRRWPTRSRIRWPGSVPGSRSWADGR